MHESSSAFALNALRKMNVDVWLNTRVVDYDGRSIITADGRKLDGALLIWAAGVKANLPSGMPETAIRGGRLLTNAFCQVNGVDHIYAIGDVARMETSDYPNGHPMMAQPAMQQGELLASNFIRMKRGKELIPFQYKDLGSMATIGRAEAVAELPFIRLKGWFAWVTWLLVHVYQLIGFRNKIVVMLNWSQNYFRRSRDLRLIIRPFSRKRE
jgi:NADH dehydrogenase